MIGAALRFDHHRTDLVFVQERLPDRDFVLAQRPARRVPLLEKLLREKTRPAIDVGLPLGRRLPDQDIPLTHGRVEDIPLDLVVVVEELGGIDCEIVAFEPQAELDLGLDVAPTGDILGHQEEDQA